MKNTISSNELNILAMRVFIRLRLGEKNVISGMELARMFGYKDDRQIQYAIEVLLDEGCEICSTTKPPYGYFLPASQEEKQRCIDGLRKRAARIFERANKIEKGRRKIMQLPLGVE